MASQASGQSRAGLDRVTACPGGRDVDGSVQVLRIAAWDELPAFEPGDAAGAAHSDPSRDLGTREYGHAEVAALPFRSWLVRLKQVVNPKQAPCPGAVPDQ